MKRLHPTMIIGYGIEVLMMIYGGEKAAQKTPLGFTLFTCGAIVLPIVATIAILC